MQAVNLSKVFCLVLFFYHLSVEKNKTKKQGLLFILTLHRRCGVQKSYL